MGTSGINGGSRRKSGGVSGRMKGGGEASSGSGGASEAKSGGDSHGNSGGASWTSGEHYLQFNSNSSDQTMVGATIGAPEDKVEAMVEAETVDREKPPSFSEFFLENVKRKMKFSREGGRAKGGSKFP